MKPIIRIGTRGSKLALWQANWVKSQLTTKNPTIEVLIQTIKTQGDKILDVPLANVGGKGLFVKEIEQSLLDNEIDIAVHSLKDMPAEIPDGLCIIAIPEREDPNDVMISLDHQKLLDLPMGAKIGTSSLRRSAQLNYFRKDLQVLSLRGNIDTRLKKLETEHLDAVILAAAGVKRLGLEYRITERLSHELMLPAVGQGALCIESRQNDKTIASYVQFLNHKPSELAVFAERAFLKQLGGSCQIPIAAYATIEQQSITITGLVCNINGTQLIKDTVSGGMEQAEHIGIQLATRLLQQGAASILESIKHA
ncbi:MAG: hydroxymethylbilane synthase [Desulfobacterales bacterium]|nr:hydroxymethylbilane synthase [Desulfobacterales bacterium]